MKRIVIFLLLTCVICAMVFAQRSIYVSARGDDENDGLSERRPVKTTFIALAVALLLDDVDTITIIGTLDKNSEILHENNVFGFLSVNKDILITGKPDATGSERAILSAKGSNKVAVYITGANTKIRFEHIEISGGEGDLGFGLLITDGAQVTLGQGTVVRNNNNGGIFINEGTCIINGAEVRDNPSPGIMVINNGAVTMRNGVIRDNRSPGNAGGVLVGEGGRFTMTGGTITGNRAPSNYRGGGVYIAPGGRFEQTGGTISGNTAGRDPNVAREPNTFGSNLTPGSSTSTTSTSSTTGSSGNPPPPPKSKAVYLDMPVFLGLYGQGLHLNSGSLGLLLQLGLGINFRDSFSINILGEAGGGFGYPYMLEWNFGGMGELHFFDTFGLGAGYGMYKRILPWGFFDSEDDIINSMYMRFSLIFLGESKTSLFANHYDGAWNELDNWGFGIQWGFKW